MLSVRGMTMLNDDIDTLSEQVHRLLIENKLLRAASEEQRELNGELRQTIQSSTDSIMALSAWVNWFKTWGSLIDGDCYAEGCNLIEKSMKVIV